MVRKNVWIVGGLLALGALLPLWLPATGCAKKDKPASIAFWNIYTQDPEKAVIAEAVARYQAGHPGTAVSVVAIQNDPFKQKIETTLAGGRPPEVFQTWGGSVLAEQAREGRVKELVGAGWTEGVKPSALEICSRDGKLYALPTSVDVILMWYNTELFKAHGIEVPRTFDELLSACKKLRGAGVTPIALAGAEKWPAAFYFNYLAVRRGGLEPCRKAAALAPGAFQDAAFVEAGRDVRRMIEAGAFNDGFQQTGVDDAYQLFFEGKAAMLLMGSWVLGKTRDKAEFRQRMGVFAFPGMGMADNDGLVVGGVNAGFALAAGAGSQAEELMKELGSRATAKRWLAETYRIPARTDLDMTGLDVPPQTLVVMDILKQAPGVQPYFDQYFPASLRQLHKDTTFDLFAGRLTPEEAAAKMEAEAEKIRRMK